MVKLSAPIDEQLYGLRVREGCYDTTTPRERLVKVVVTVPDLPVVTLLLPSDAAHALLGDGVTPWPELAERALEIREAIGAAPRGDVTRLAEWLDITGNWDAYAMAWAAHRARWLRRRGKKTLVLLGEHCRGWGITLPEELPSMPAVAGADEQPDTATIRAAAGRLGVHLAVWQRRDDSRAQPEVRRAANDAMDIIDRLMADLHTVRQRLLLEIRHSDDATNARIDALLASIRTGA